MINFLENLQYQQEVEFVFLCPAQEWTKNTL